MDNGPNPQTMATDCQEYSQVGATNHSSLTLHSNENQGSSSFPTQPPSFTSASMASMGIRCQPASHQDRAAAYAVPAFIDPIAKSSSSDDYDFFEYLHHLFASESKSHHAVASDTTQQQQTINSNVDYLMDPITWLSSNKPFPYSVEPTASEMTMDPPKACSSSDDGHHQPENMLHHDDDISDNASSSSPKQNVVKAAAGKSKSKHDRQVHTTKSNDASRVSVAPFDFLKNMLAERGYYFATIKSSDVGYMTDPSPLQLASFGTKLVDAVHRSDVDVLTSFFQCGLSPNPCNQFRDFPLSWVCRKAQDSVFHCFLDHQADIHVCDGFGRTPLHYAAWADTFSPIIAAGILQRDPIQLFLKDNTGRTPLEYVPSKTTTQWKDFLDHRKDEFFPINGPPLVVTKRELLHLPDPPSAISVDLARLVSSGQVRPEQVIEGRLCQNHGSVFSTA